MEEIIKNLEKNINRLLQDGSRAFNWDNEVKCSETVKNLCIAYSCLTRKDKNENQEKSSKD